MARWPFDRTIRVRHGAPHRGVFILFRAFCKDDENNEGNILTSRDLAMGIKSSRDSRARERGEGAEKDRAPSNLGTFLPPLNRRVIAAGME